MRQKLIGIFLVGLFLLNYPVLSLFGPQYWVFDMPLLYFYFFATWLILIILACWIIEKKEPTPSETKNSS